MNPIVHRTLRLVTNMFTVLTSRSVMPNVQDGRRESGSMSITYLLHTDKCCLRNVYVESFEPFHFIEDREESHVRIDCQLSVTILARLAAVMPVLTDQAKKVGIQMIFPRLDFLFPSCEEELFVDKERFRCMIVQFRYHWETS